MNILAIDPGPAFSAYVVWSGDKIHQFGKVQNGEMLLTIGGFMNHMNVVCEMVACYGMAVGAEVFETAVWIGRFQQHSDIHHHHFDRLYRRDVKIHLCGSMKAKDGNIRQALIDKLGAPGTKKNAGPTYGIAGDVWQALAVAVTFAETRNPCA